MDRTLALTILTSAGKTDIIYPFGDIAASFPERTPVESKSYRIGTNINTTFRELWWRVVLNEHAPAYDVYLAVPLRWRPCASESKADFSRRDGLSGPRPQKKNCHFLFLSKCESWVRGLRPGGRRQPERFGRPDPYRSAGQPNPRYTIPRHDDPSPLRKRITYSNSLFYW